MGRIERELFGWQNQARMNERSNIALLLNIMGTKNYILAEPLVKVCDMNTLVDG